MWDLYNEGQKHVAIKSNVGRFLDGIGLRTNDLSKMFACGAVQYIDFEEEGLPSPTPDLGEKQAPYDWLTPFFYKRKSFAHEKEFRAAVVDQEILSDTTLGETVTGENPDLKPGMSIGADIDELIEAVYVSPIAPGYLKGLVADLVERYDMDVEVRPSRIDREPNF